MVEIPNSLRSVFSAIVREHDGAYVVNIPSEEIDHDAVTPGEAYRVAVFESSATTGQADQESEQPGSVQSDRQRKPSQPPVEEDEIRDVTIETVGDEGDGIAKVDRGYVVIIPGVQPGDEPTVKIEQVKQNVAFATVVDPDPRTL